MSWTKFSDVHLLSLEQRKVIARNLWGLAQEFIRGWEFEQFFDEYFDSSSKKIKIVSNQIYVKSINSEITCFVIIQFTGFDFRGKKIYTARSYAASKPEERGCLTTIKFCWIEYFKFYMFHFFNQIYFLDVIMHPSVYLTLNQIDIFLLEGQDLMNDANYGPIARYYCEQEGIKTRNNYLSIEQGDQSFLCQQEIDSLRRKDDKYINSYIEKTKLKNGVILFFVINFSSFYAGFRTYAIKYCRNKLKKLVL